MILLPEDPYNGLTDIDLHRQADVFYLIGNHKLIINECTNNNPLLLLIAFKLLSAVEFLSLHN